MTAYERYGIYVVPEGPLYEAGAAWLGWDSVGGRGMPPPQLPGLPRPAEAITATPRKYGFHGTIKPPFRLAHGTDLAALDGAAKAFCATRSPVDLPALEVVRLDGFIAIVPATPSPALAALAAATVEALDPHRAPPTEVELAKRRKAGLSARQEAMLQRWGYPYVMADFRFHLTLTGRLSADEAETVRDSLARHFAPVLAAALVIDSLCLMGEDAAGRFHLIQRHALSG